MQFRDQVEQLIQCKVQGICHRDTLATKSLSEGLDNRDDMFRSMLYDNYFILALLEILNE